MKEKSESEVVQSCPTLSDPMDCSLPGSSIHGIFQARVLEWGDIAFSELDLTNPQTPKMSAKAKCGLVVAKPAGHWLLQTGYQHETDTRCRD